MCVSERAFHSREDENGLGSTLMSNKLDSFLNQDSV